MTHFLETTLIKLLAIRPACLLLPDSWDRHSTVLRSLAERMDHPQIAHGVQRLDERNRRLQQSSKVPPATAMTPAAQIYRILDGVDYSKTVRVEDVSTECMDVISNPVNLVSILLQWACSYYREGSYRACLATRLLRRWAHLGADIYECVVGYLEGMSWVESGDARKVFKIVSELVRSKTFAAGRYMQWLIATGSIAQNLDLSQVSPFHPHARCIAYDHSAYSVAHSFDHGDTHQRFARSDTHSACNTSSWNSSQRGLGRRDTGLCEACHITAATRIVRHKLFWIGLSQI